MWLAISTFLLILFGALLGSHMLEVKSSGWFSGLASWGDIALHTAWHKLSGEPKPNSEEFLEIAERWRPFRSVAARMLWHFYLSERRKHDR